MTDSLSALTRAMSSTAQSVDPTSSGVCDSSSLDPSTRSLTFHVFHRCQSSQCVPESKLCDGTADCDDKSDEGDDCPVHQCDGFKCPNGPCITTEQVRSK